MEYLRSWAMIDIPHADFRELARQLTRLRVDGVDVNPNEVAVDVSASVDGCSASQFEMEISSVALQHELQQAGIVDELNELADFVCKDVAAQPQPALAGYLEIVRAVMGVEPQRRPWWKVFAKTVDAGMPEWTLVRVVEIVTLENKLVMRGLAKRHVTTG